MGMFKNVIAPGLMLTIASPLWAASGPFFFSPQYRFCCINKLYSVRLGFNLS